MSLPKNTSHSHDGGDDGKLQAGRFLRSLRKTTEEEERPSQLLATALRRQREAWKQLLGVDPVFFLHTSGS